MVVAGTGLAGVSSGSSGAEPSRRCKLISEKSGEIEPPALWKGELCWGFSLMVIYISYIDEYVLRKHISYLLLY